MSDELTELLQAEKSNPNDDQLLSKIAFYYLANPDGRKDLEYFKKAYEANPNIKNTHNYAFWAYYEYGETDLALPLFKALIAKNPKSFYPYMAYGGFLLDNLKSGEAFCDISHQKSAILKTYQQALQSSANAPSEYRASHPLEMAYIHNNLGCAYLENGQFVQADEQFNQAIHILLTAVQGDIDDHDRSFFNEVIFLVSLNKVRLKILQNDLTTAKIFLQIAAKNEQAITEDVATLYALLGDYQTCHDIAPDLHSSFDWIWHAIYQINPKRYQDKIADEITQTKLLVAEYRADLEICQEQAEKQAILEDIAYIEIELAELEKLQHQPPKLRLSAQDARLADLHYFYKCWLLGCENCHNLTNDDNEWIGA